MSMVNTRTKPIPIKATSSSVKKSSSTSSPQSSSSASPQTSSSSSNESPATTIQTLVRPGSSRTSFSNAQNSRDVCQSTRSTKSASDVPSASTPSLRAGAPGTVNSLSAQNSFRYEPLAKADAPDAAAPLTQNNATVTNNTQLHYHISSDILDDLASRFIINVPDDERNNLIRICFQIELAHWFYLDFFCINDEKKCGMKQFAMSLFHHIPFLRVHLAAIDKILENWKQYKLTVPTYGAILLSEDLNYVLLVQSYWAKSSWGFPKGKVNENEDPIHCAAREVYEETGYDITHLIVRSDYIESIINDQYTRLYLVCNVPLKTLFMPRTRKEIKCCEWFSIDSLPTSKNDANVKQNLGINANSFFMIMPFIKRLKKWVSDKRSGNIDGTSSQFNCNKSKFNGQLASNNAINNAIPTNSRKMDANKLPHKVTPTAATTNSTAGNQPTVLGLTYQNSANNGSSKASTSNKRQRHKSMGDLDGMVKSNQVINGFHNNLVNKVNPVKVQTNATTTFNSVFNDIHGSSATGTNCDSYEHREKTLKHNIRRQKSINNSGCWKIMETTAFTSVGVESTSVSVGPNKTTEAKTMTSSTITTYHYDNMKENVDISKQLHTKSPKLNNLPPNGFYYNYCNSGLNKRNDVQSKSKRSVSASNQKENVPNKKPTQESTSKPISLLKRTKSIEIERLGLTTAATDKLVTSNVETQIPLEKSTDSPKKALARLTSSPNFSSWRTFSFADRCIANVFC